MAKRQSRPTSKTNTEKIDALYNLLIPQDGSPSIFERDRNLNTRIDEFGEWRKEIHAVLVTGKDGRDGVIKIAYAADDRQKSSSKLAWTVTALVLTNLGQLAFNWFGK